MFFQAVPKESAAGSTVTLQPDFGRWPRREASMLLCATFAAALAAVAADRPLRTAEGALDAERAWVQALETRDAARLGQLLADGFVDVTWRGEARSRAQVLADLTARPAAAIELSGLTARLYGDTAVVRGLNTVRAPDGGLVGRVRFTDVFVWRGGAWRAVAAQESLAAPGPAPEATGKN
jgi:hypothetical protein